MTENKRFKRISVCGDWGVKDTEKDKVLFFGTTDEVINTIELLNNLVDENEQLKQSIKRQQSSNEECSKYIEEVAKENEQLKSEIEKITTYKEHWAFISDCSIQVMNEEEKFKEDYLRIATNELKKLQEENEQLKQQEKRLYKYFRECFNNVSEQGFRETWEVVKNND